MIIDDFIRNEENQVVAICGETQVVLTAEYIAINKPQIGDEIVKEEPVVEAEAPAPVEAEAPAEAPVEQ
jgi:hypothetical protein